MTQPPRRVTRQPRTRLATPLLAIVIPPLAVAFVIAASLAAGPREVWKALRDRGDPEK